MGFCNWRRQVVEDNDLQISSENSEKDKEVFGNWIQRPVEVENCLISD
jgi:hypothetical protein